MFLLRRAHREASPFGQRAEGVRYMVVNVYQKVPPATWASKPASYYADKLTTPGKLKAVGAQAQRDYKTLRDTWLHFEVQANSADTARALVNSAMKGNEVAAAKIRVGLDKYGLLKGTPLDLGRLPRKPAAPLEPRFTISKASKDRVGYPRIDREAGEELKPGDFNPAAMFMGFYSQEGTDTLEGLPGIKLVTSFTEPFQLNGVSPDRIGFAHIPMIVVSGLALERGDFGTTIARPFAVAFAKAHGLVFDLYSPSIYTRRGRIAEDRNPGSPTFGKQRRMVETDVRFEVPETQLARMTKEQHDWFSYGQLFGTIPRWGQKEADRWLGLDKVEQIGAWRKEHGIGVAPAPREPAEVIPLHPGVPGANPLGAGPDSPQMRAGRDWAQRKGLSPARAVAIAQGKLTTARSVKDIAFWTGVLAWGEGR